MTKSLNKEYDIPSNKVGLLKARLESLPDAFIANLKNKHPDLTKSEIKFCTYVKMQLSPVEIASILNISNEGIKKKKYRIRKKFALNRNDSLEFFISKF